MAATPSCPRCGYDLSGAIASWQDACPLSTTCSECGLLFELRLVLNQRLRDKTRFFEAARFHQASSLLTTVRSALRPWAFWRWVVMEYTPNLPRMISGVALATLLVEAAALALAAALISLAWFIDLITGNTGRWYPSWSGQESWDQWLQFLAPWSLERWDQETVGALLLLAIMIQLLMPVVFLLLPQTLRKAKVRHIHLVRIGLWSFVGVPMVVAAVQFLHLSVQLLSWAVGYLVTRPGPFTLTPAEEFFSNIDEFLIQQQDLLLLGVIAAWTMLWWGLAVGRYLKLPHPWLITLAMGAIAALASTLACLLHPTLWYAIGLRF